MRSIYYFSLRNKHKIVIFDFDIKHQRLHVALGNYAEFIMASLVLFWTFIHAAVIFFAGLLAEPGVTANWRKYQNQSPLQFRHIHKHW